MKLTAVPFTAILLVVGSSCNTKGKTENYIPDDNVVAQKTWNEEKATAAPLPRNKKTSALKTAKAELVDVYIHPSICEGIIDNGDVIPPPVEDSIEDDYMVLLGCNLESEAEYPGGTKAWLRYLHGNVQVPKDIIDSETDTNVVVQFVVDEEGCVREAKAVRGSMELGAEVVRVINESSRWIPAKRLSTDKCIRSFKM
ncbi:energy transducer TonB [Niastella sp. OAS944]|uniref:energy transducer TonB n=1 Tax=Niastella sp. OAS944 TaxID=2664089 RepID=UPI003477CB9F|nr:hypothetical protein [Chitinophagaceae bacterium OAS944]